MTSRVWPQSHSLEALINNLVFTWRPRHRGRNIAPIHKRQAVSLCNKYCKRPSKQQGQSNKQIMIKTATNKRHQQIRSKNNK